MIWESLQVLPSKYIQNLNTCYHLCHSHSGLSLCCLLIDDCSGLNQFPSGLAPCSLISAAVKWFPSVKIRSGHSSAVEPSSGCLFQWGWKPEPIYGSVSSRKLWLLSTSSGFSPPPPVPSLQPHSCQGGSCLGAWCLPFLLWTAYSPDICLLFLTSWVFVHILPELTPHP